MISLGHLFYKLVCKETPKTKFAFVRVELTQADINASNYSTVPTSVLFERTPESILELAFQDGSCIFSINNPFNFQLLFQIQPDGARHILFVYLIHFNISCCPHNLYDVPYIVRKPIVHKPRASI